MSKLKLTQTIFDELADLLENNETQKFINYFNNGCKNINFGWKFTPSDTYSAAKTTILYIAGYYRNIEAMKCLIKNGASFYGYNIVVFNKLCGMMNYENYCERYEQHGVDDYSFMKFCLENGADPNWTNENKIISGFQEILSNVKEESIIELFINYGANVYNFYANNTSILKKLIYNQKLTLESKLRLINKIKRSYSDEELYNLSKKILESDLPDKDEITKELDTIESNGKSAAKIKIT